MNRVPHSYVLPLLCGALVHLIALEFRGSVARAQAPKSSASQGDRTWRSPFVSDAKEVDSQMAEGLRQRRLFRLAQIFCRERLADSQLEPRHRVEMLVQLIRCHADQARHTPMSNRKDHWQKAHQTAGDAVSQNPSLPAGELVRFEDAATHLAEGELARLEAELGTGDQALEVSRQTLRVASRGFDALEKHLQQASVGAPNGLSPAGALNPAEMRSLLNHVHHQQARVMKNQALTYPKGSNDRISSLLKAVEQLGKPLTQLAADDDLAWQLRLEAAVVKRMLGELPQADRLLSELEKAAPAELAPQVLAERIRLLVAAGRADAGLQLLVKQPLRNVHVDLARLDCYLRLWQDARNANNGSATNKRADDLRQNATKVVDYIQLTWGAYWGRVAEVRLVGAVGSGQDVGDVALLRRIGDDHVKRKQYDNALQSYDKAYRKAMAGNDVESALVLASLAAQVEQRKGNVPAYLERLRRAAVQYPQSATAMGMYYSAVGYSAAALAASGKKGADEEFLFMLQEFLQHWPKSKYSDQVRIWYGTELYKSGKLQLTLAQFQQVSTDYAELAGVLRNTEIVWRQLLNSQTDTQRQQQLALQAVGHFGKVLLGPDKRLPERFSDPLRQAAVSAVRIHLQYLDRNNLATVEAWLIQAIQNSPQAADSWKSEAYAVLIHSLSARGQIAQASAALQSLPAGDPTAQLTLFDNLNKLNASAQNASTGKQIGELQLKVLALVESQGQLLTDSQRASLPRRRALALAAAGQRATAVKQLNQLLAASPKDLKLWIARAELLVESNEANDLKLALQQWRILAKNLPQNSELRFQARYNICLALYKQRQYKEASTRIKLYLQTSGPKLTDSPWRRKFEALLAKCTQ